MEQWKMIKGYTNYMVSNLGNVKSLNYNHTGKEKILKYKIDKYGYYLVCLYKKGVKKFHTIHRLVAEAFIPNPDNKPCIDHINTDKTENRIDNLRWVTSKENNNNPLTKTHRSDSLKGQKNYMFSKFGKEHHNSKEILQFSLHGEFIKKWDSQADIERELLIKQSSISECCKNKRKTSGGYKWGYEYDYERIPFKVFDLTIYRKKVA